jgi:hypothetical protein
MLSWYSPTAVQVPAEGQLTEVTTASGIGPASLVLGTETATAVELTAQAEPTGIAKDTRRAARVAGSNARRARRELGEADERSIQLPFQSATSRLAGREVRVRSHPEPMSTNAKLKDIRSRWPTPRHRLALEFEK